MQKMMIELTIVLAALVLRIGLVFLKPVGWFLAALHAAEDRRAAAERLEAVRSGRSSAEAEEEKGSSSRGILTLLLLLLLPSFLAGLMEGE